MSSMMVNVIRTIVDRVQTYDEGKIDPVDLARVVIVTMREPTEAMLDATPYPGYEGPSSKEIWQAMIDEALK